MLSIKLYTVKFDLVLVVIENTQYRLNLVFNFWYYCYVIAFTIKFVKVMVNYINTIIWLFYYPIVTISNTDSLWKWFQDYFCWMHTVFPSLERHVNYHLFFLKYPRDISLIKCSSLYFSAISLSASLTPSTLLLFGDHRKCLKQITSLISLAFNKTWMVLLNQAN